MTITYSPSFSRQYKKLSVRIKHSAEKAEQIFRKSLFDPRLDTHKLHGRQKEYWSFSVTRGVRIVFEIIEKDDIRFHRIGNHDDVYE